MMNEECALDDVLSNWKSSLIDQDYSRQVNVRVSDDEYFFNGHNTRSIAARIKAHPRKYRKSKSVALRSWKCLIRKKNRRRCCGFQIVLFDIAYNPEWKKLVVAYREAQRITNLSQSGCSSKFSNCEFRKEVKVTTTKTRRKCQHEDKKGNMTTKPTTGRTTIEKRRLSEEEEEAFLGFEPKNTINRLTSTENSSNHIPRIENESTSRFTTLKFVKSSQFSLDEEQDEFYGFESEHFSNKLIENDSTSMEVVHQVDDRIFKDIPPATNDIVWCSNTKDENSKSEDIISKSVGHTDLKKTDGCTSRENLDQCNIVNQVSNEASIGQCVPLEPSEARKPCDYEIVSEQNIDKNESSLKKIDPVHEAFQKKSAHSEETNELKRFQVATKNSNNFCATKKNKNDNNISEDIEVFDTGLLDLVTQSNSTLKVSKSDKKICVRKFDLLKTTYRQNDAKSLEVRHFNKETEEVKSDSSQKSITSINEFRRFRCYKNLRRGHIFSQNMKPQREAEKIEKGLSNNFICPLVEHHDFMNIPIDDSQQRNTKTAVNKSHFPGSTLVPSPVSNMDAISSIKIAKVATKTSPIVKGVDDLESAFDECISRIKITNVVSKKNASVPYNSNIENIPKSYDISKGPLSTHGVVTTVNNIEYEMDRKRSMSRGNLKIEKERTNVTVNKCEDAKKSKGKKASLVRNNDGQEINQNTGSEDDVAFVSNASSNRNEIEDLLLQIIRNLDPDSVVTPVNSDENIYGEILEKKSCRKRKSPSSTSVVTENKSAPNGINEKCTTANRESDCSINKTNIHSTLEGFFDRDEKRLPFHHDHTYTTFNSRNFENIQNSLNENNESVLETPHENAVDPYPPALIRSEECSNNPLSILKPRNQNLDANLMNVEKSSDVCVLSVLETPHENAVDPYPPASIQSEECSDNSLSILKPWNQNLDANLMNAENSSDVCVLKNDKKEKKIGSISDAYWKAVQGSTNSKSVICWKCGISCKCDRMFGIHFTSSHLDSSVLQCLYCSKEFKHTESDEFEQHYNEHLHKIEKYWTRKALENYNGEGEGAYLKLLSKDGGVYFCCLKCNHRTTSCRTIEIHLQKMHHVMRKRNISCDYCTLQLSSGVAKRYHCLNQHRKKMMCCEYCFWLYTSKPSYSIHLKTCPIRRIEENKHIPDHLKSVEVNLWWTQNNVTSINWSSEHDGEKSRRRQIVAEQILKDVVSNCAPSHNTNTYY